MKSGTSSLHHILNQHEDIFIPDAEIFFFDLDDIEQHPDFFVYMQNGWSDHYYDSEFNKYLSWYQTFFEAARDNQLIGEDSTTYLASPKAARRIASLLPNVKLIFMLRDPVYRTYSHYWHLVRTGRVIYDFERTIQYTPGTLLQRSLYKKQIENYKKLFSDKNIKIIIFEDFIEDTQGHIHKICDFLGLKKSIDISDIDVRKNPAQVPRSFLLQILSNRIFRDFVCKYYIKFLPNMPSYQPNLTLDLVYKAISKINLTTEKHYPPIKKQTKIFLQKLFARENHGLSDLIRIDIEKYWPYMKK